MDWYFWLKVWFFFYIIYTFVIIRYINRLFKENIKAFKQIPKDMQEKYSPFMRKEVYTMKKWKLQMGAVFLFPFRFFMFMSTIVIWSWNLRYLSWGQDPSKPYSEETRRKIREQGKWLNSWIVYWMVGCWKIEIIKKKFEEFDPEYKELDETINHEKSPLIITNHMGLCDGHIPWLLDLGPGILAKWFFKTAPIYSTILTRGQSPFVNRKDPEQRKNVLNILKERSHLSANTTMAPLMLFPEGTVSNGNQLLTFKKGAFKELHPLRIFCLKYEGNQYIPWNCDMGDFPYILFGISNFSLKVKVYQFDRLFDPTYLNLDKDDENAWKIYAEKVRTIMAKCLGVPKSELGYRSAKEFEKIYQDTLKTVRCKVRSKKSKRRKNMQIVHEEVKSDVQQGISSTNVKKED